MKTTLITIAIVLVALSLIQTASALSMFVHNENVPDNGAQITFTVNDETIRYQYHFHKLITIGTPDVELPLPTQFQVGDMVSITTESNYFIPQTSAAGPMSDRGLSITVDLSNRLP